MVDIFSVFHLLIVAGIAGGIVSTTVMSVFEIIPWRRWRVHGVFEWHENQILVEKYFKNILATEDTVNFRGILLLHYINGILAAITYVIIIWYFIEQKVLEYSLVNAFVTGIVYAIFLWVVTLFPIHKPITGLNPINHPLGHGPVIFSLAGHFIYALILGFWVFIFI